MEIIKLDSQYDYSWKYMPQLLHRAEKFCDDLNTDTNPEYLIPNLKQHFIQKSETVKMWIGVEDGRIVGHLIAEVNNTYGEPTVLVLQAKIDDNEPLVTRKVWKELIDWTKGLDIKTITCVTKRTVGSFMRKYGFKEKSVILEMEV